ncbi:MAG: AbrB/MazE/SpoVT family DNA-binding domain-containing protein [Proteobacteria bacterium]|nr:AbrB/MazE/SpoVT family DNA-binding domain-containing protein [Pseudomonadota bacterium]
MALTTITSKGQVTIPIGVRKSLHLDVGDKIEIIVTKDNEAVIRLVSKKVDEVFGQLKSLNKNTKAVTVQEMNDAIKTRAKEKFK